MGDEPIGQPLRRWQEGLLPAGRPGRQRHKFRRQDVGDDGDLHQLLTGCLRVTLEPGGQLVDHLRVDLAVHYCPEPFGDDEIAQRKLLQPELAHDEPQRLGELVQAGEQSRQHVHTAGPPAGLIKKSVLDALYVVALLHGAGQPLLICRCEEVHLADLAQVHPDRVVDPLLQLETGDLSLRLLVQLLGPRLSPLLQLYGCAGGDAGRHDRLFRPLICPGRHAAQLLHGLLFHLGLLRDVLKEVIGELVPLALALQQVSSLREFLSHR